MDVYDERGSSNRERVKVLQASRHAGDPRRGETTASGVRRNPRVITIMKGSVLRAHIHQSPFGPAIVPVDGGVKFGNLHFFQPDTGGDAAWRCHITPNLYLRISLDNSQPVGLWENGGRAYNESECGG
jgi:hypothetical protein